MNILYNVVILLSKANSSVHLHSLVKLAVINSTSDNSDMECYLD